MDMQWLQRARQDRRKDDAGPAAGSPKRRIQVERRLPQVEEFIFSDLETHDGMDVYTAVGRYG